MQKICLLHLVERHLEFPIQRVIAKGQTEARGT